MSRDAWACEHQDRLGRGPLLTGGQELGAGGADQSYPSIGRSTHDAGGGSSDRSRVHTRQATKWRSRTALLSQGSFLRGDEGCTFGGQKMPANGGVHRISKSRQAPER
jgi:hypothetical protein